MRSERYCPFCKDNCIEEYRALFNYPQHDDKRNMLFSKIANTDHAMKLDNYEKQRLISSPAVALQVTCTLQTTLRRSQSAELTIKALVHVPDFGGCQGRRTGVGVTTVSNSLILGGRVTKVPKNGDEK